MAAGDEWDRFAEEPLPPPEPDDQLVEADRLGPSSGGGAGPDREQGADDDLPEYPSHPPEPVTGERHPLDADATSARARHDDVTPPTAAEAQSEAPLAGTAEVIAQLAQLATGVAGLRAELRRLAELTAQQGSFVDKLHADNERLRRVEADRLRDPLVRELIALADTQLRNARRWEAEQSPAALPVAEALRGVSGDVQLLLDRQGVESYQPSTGERFDRKQHRSRGTAETYEPEQADAVADVLLPGYRIGDRTIRPAEVIVWRVTRAPQATGSSEELASTPQGHAPVHETGTASAEHPLDHRASDAATRADDHRRP